MPDLDFEDLVGPEAAPEATNDDDVADEDGYFRVHLPSGGVFRGCVTADEVVYIRDRSERYMEDNHFVNVSDLQDVDRMVVLEMLVMRWSEYVATGYDQQHNEVDDVELRKSIKDISNELRQLKKTLGIDKTTRDKERGEDSPAGYIASLKRRAKEFGIKREQELDKALELFKELNARLTLHDNCDPEEAKELKARTEDLLSWIRDEAIPEYDRIDEYFRNRPDGQRFWRGTL